MNEKAVAMRVRPGTTRNVSASVPGHHEGRPERELSRGPREPTRQPGTSRCRADKRHRLHDRGHGNELDDLEIATCAWVSWFNDERLHGELNDQTPSEVEGDYAEQSRAHAA